MEVFRDEAACHFPLFESQWRNSVRKVSWHCLICDKGCLVGFLTPLPKEIPILLSMQKVKEHSCTNNLVQKNMDSSLSNIKLVAQVNDTGISVFLRISVTCVRSAKYLSPDCFIQMLGLAFS